MNSARIHCKHLHAVETGKHADARSSFQNITQHLAGNFLGKGAYPLFRHAVISRCDNDKRRFHAQGSVSAADHEQTRRNIFQAAQTAPRLG